MEQKKFDLPRNPMTGKSQCIVVERINKNDVWKLVVEPDKAIPLPNLENPESAKQILDVAKEQMGEGFVAEFVGSGFSKTKQENEPK